MKNFNDSFPKIPQSELEVMQAVWEMSAGGAGGQITAGALMQYSEELGRLQLTTVLTLITRLMKKGFLAAQKNGRAYSYTPLVAEEDYRSAATADFVATMYKNDTGSLITALWCGGAMSEDDLRELKKLIGDAEA